MVPDVLVIGSIFTLFVFLAFYVFKRWYGMDNFRNYSTSKRLNSKPPAVDAINVNNPFFIELEKQQLIENESVTIKMMTKRTCILRNFWNANLAKAIKVFHSSAAKDQSTNGIQLTDYLTKCCAFQSEERLIHPTNEETYSHICHADNLDQILEENAASTNKLCTLIVSMGLTRNASNEAVRNEDIVSLLTILKAERNNNSKKTDWKIDYQIIQTAGGRLFTLRNLYSSGVPDLESEATASVASSSKQQSDLCIICHSNHVTRAFLPCRHQCVCGACFSRTKLCPVCRRPVESYLITSDESHLPMPLPDEEELAEQTREGLNGMGLFELIKAIWNAS